MVSGRALLRVTPADCNKLVVHYQRAYQLGGKNCYLAIHLHRSLGKPPCEAREKKKEKEELNEEARGEGARREAEKGVYIENRVESKSKMGAKSATRTPTKKGYSTLSRDSSNIQSPWITSWTILAS